MSVAPSAPRAPVALTPRQAADALSVSLSSFRRYVLPNIRVVRVGVQGVRVPVAELEAYVDSQAKKPAKA